MKDKEFLMFCSNKLCLGFFSETYLENQNSCTESCDNTNCGRKQSKYHLIAYVPILGAIIGLFKRIIPSIEALKNPTLEPYKHLYKHLFYFQIFRGTCETLGLGLLFLIPDMIATIGRMCSGHWFEFTGMM